jgi:Zn-dependent peptidase ImmA (M78 family)
MTDFSYRYRIADRDLDILEQFTNELPVKVGALAQALGLKVVVATLPMSISGLIKPGDDGYIVKVNRFESKERQRFTIAHEIAHYLIHRDHIRSGIVDSVLYRSKLSSRTEAEANKLAADIIMPMGLVSKHLTELTATDRGDEIGALSELFNVSRQAMEIRLG